MLIEIGDFIAQVNSSCSATHPQQKPTFRKARLREAVEYLLAVDIDTGESLIGNYINATVGFRRLMFGLNGILPRGTRRA